MRHLGGYVLYGAEHVLAVAREFLRALLVTQKATQEAVALRQRGQGVIDKQRSHGCLRLNLFYHAAPRVVGGPKAKQDIGVLLGDFLGVGRVAGAHPNPQRWKRQVLVCDIALSCRRLKVPADHGFRGEAAQVGRPNGVRAKDATYLAGHALLGRAHVGDRFEARGFGYTAVSCAAAGKQCAACAEQAAGAHDKGAPAHRCLHCLSSLLAAPFDTAGMHTW